MTLPVAPVDISSLLCPTLRSIPIVALRPRSGQRLPAGPVRLQALRFDAMHCNDLPCHPFCPTQLLGGLLPRYGKSREWGYLDTTAETLGRMLLARHPGCDEAGTAIYMHMNGYEWDTAEQQQIKEAA